MRKKLLLLRKEISFIKVIALFFFISSVSSMNAATYYWRGGNGDWSQASTHWSSVASASPSSWEFYASQPTSNDDVIFDDLSGPASGYTVNLSIGTAKAVRNITVSPTASPVTWGGSLNFLLFGDMMLSSPINFLGYSGQIWIYQQTSGLTKSMNVGSTIFRTPIVFQPNFSANTVIIGTFTSTSSLDVNLAAATDKVTFQTNVANAGGGLLIQRGEVYFEQGFDTYLGTSPDFIVSPAGKLFTKQNSKTGALYNAGLIDLNPLGSALTHNFNIITGSYYLYTSTVSNASLNIQNCTLNVNSVWSYGSSTNSIYSIQTTGSTINFKPTATEFQPKNYTFTNVNVDSLGVPFRILFESTNTITTPSFSNLNLMRDIDMQYSTTSLGILLRANIGSLKLWPGRSYVYNTSISGTFPNEAIGSCARFIVGDLWQMGQCERPIYLYKMAYELGAPATVHSANLRVYNGIWALAGPYDPGSGSVLMSGGTTNWTFPALPSSRTLIWVGATPIAANIGNQSTYGSWKNSANWRDAAELPVATGPGYLAGTPACPPTYLDSVVFPNNSYVRVDDISRAEARSVNWQGQGRIYAANNIDMDIFGALTFSSQMINDFYGTYHFKNDRPYRCRIKTSNRPFKAGVVFNAAGSSNSWLLVDSLITQNTDPDCGGGLNYSILLKNGVIHTATSNCVVGNSATIVGKLHAFAGGLNLYDSDIIVNGGLGSTVVLKIEGTTLNAGTSNFICNSQVSQSLDFGANKKYHTITLTNSSFPVSIGDPTHSLSFNYGDTVVSLKVNGNTKPWFSFLSSTSPSLIRRMDLNTTYRSIFMNSVPPVIDSLVSSVGVDLALQNSDVKVRSYLGLAPGSHVYSYFPASPNKIILMAPTGSFLNSTYSSCLSGSTSYPLGGIGALNGSCTQQILLENLIVDNLSSSVVNGSYLNIVNTPITGLGGSYTNSNTSGNTSGWTGVASTPRKLRWKNTTAANGTSGAWDDPNNWEQILPVVLPAPQCPPTRLDTALFDNTSFSGTSQKVILNSGQEVGSMYWKSIPAGQIPELVGATNVMLSVFASLEFHQNMVNNFNGIVKFRGQPNASFPQNHIASNGIQFKNAVYLFGDATTTEWILNDNIYVNGDLLFTQGRFLTNSKGVTASYMELFNATPRYFNFANSTMSFNTNGFRVYNPSNVTIVSTNSTINAAGNFLGGGKIYNDVNGVNSLNFEISNGEEFRNIHLIAGNTNMATSSSATGLKVKKILKENNTFIFNVNYSLIDSMLLFGPVLSETKILSSNKYFKDFEVKEGTTLTLGASTVQWFQNKCDVDLIGTPSGTIQFFSTSSSLGGQAYLRKDSAVVCADYINMLNIHCVGNGNDPGASCSTYNNALNPNVNTLCTSAHPYLVSSCDTITDATSACGPWEILLPLRGRASFTAGSAADNQLSSCRGWDFKPYPPVPSTVLASGSPSICLGQSVTLTITGVGKLPFDLDYSDSNGNIYFQTITNASQLASYNPTTFAFTFTTTVTPTSSVTYYAGSIAIDRCFNNVSPPGVGSVAITVNQFPAITNAGSPIAICSGSTGSFVPTTSIPASVSWTSPSVGGITGHATAGSTNINEALTSSNASPTTITYTLTPSAAGCVGTPVTQDIVVNPLPNVVSGATQSLDCNNSSVNVSVSSSTPGVNYAWSGPSIVSGGNTNTATVNGVGTYTCVVTNPATGCARNGSVAVNFTADVIVPTISCQANIAVNTSASSCNASVVTTNPTINDNCSVSTLRWSMTGATVDNSPLTGTNYIGTYNFNLGTTNVTYTVIDASGNQTICNFQVQVIDNVNPVITCPGNINAFTSTSSCSRSIATPSPAISDNCTVPPTLTWTITQGATVIATGSGNIGTRVFGLGTSTVTYTVTDASGNSSSCSYTVTVIDNVAPVISCPGNISAFTSTSSCSASIATPNPAISDNCTISSLTWTITQGATLVATGSGNINTAVFGLGTSTVTYTVTDGSGNVSQCSYTVNVVDNVNPVISCPGNISAFTSSSSCTAIITTPDPTVTDNCTVSSTTWTVTQGALVLASGTGYLGNYEFVLGVSSVNYTAIDAAGNSSTCSYLVTVTDNVAPTVICPANISVNTSSSSCDASVNVPSVVFGDNCTVSSVSWLMSVATVGASPLSGINQVGTQTFNSGTTTIAYTITDASSNQSTCSFTVTVTDATPPVAPSLPNVLGQCAATVPIPVATDNCAGFVNGTTSDPLVYNAQGTYTVNWTFTDASGNVTTAVQTVIIDNNLPPTPPVLATLVGECCVTVTAPTATTGCSGPVIGTTTDPLVYCSQGTYTVTWTFDDGMGNVVTSQQTVIVDDITPPVVPVVSNVSDECSVVLTAPTTTDNCVGMMTGTTSNPTSYSSQGTFNVVWNFDDGNGNETNVIQTVTIADITNPTFSNCPSDIAVSNDLGDCGALVSWTPPSANDNCAGYTVTSSHNPGDFFNLGITTVTYTVTDIAGNTEICTFDVEVTDTEAPEITGCPLDISVSNDPSICGAIVNWVLPTPSDNCPGVLFTSTHDSGDLFPTGTTTVTYTATDAYGNTSTCTFDITVTDTESPIFANCPSDITVNNDAGICGAVVSWTPMSATDNCSTVTIVGSHNPGDLFPVGTTTVTYTGTDDNGNSVTCSFDVIVIDTEDPIISGLTDISICEGGAATWNVTATDNCSIQSLTSNYSSGIVLPLGTTWVVYTAIDGSGNTVVDSFAVNVFASSAVSVESEPATEICVGDNVSLNVVNPVAGATYSWEFGGSPAGSGSPLDLTNIQFNQNGTYQIISNLPGGCISYGSITIGVDFCDLLIPEAVTPNADGDNDTWYIENLENYANSKVQIVNRWGVVVFESDDYKNDWDGTSHSALNIGGDQLPEGTFYYVLQIGGDASSKFYGKIFTGYIYLKR